MNICKESSESKRSTLELFEINRGQNYFLRLSVLMVEIIPTVLRKAIEKLGPKGGSIKTWLLSEPVWTSLKKSNINQTQWSKLYNNSKNKGPPDDAVDTLNSLDVSLSSIFISRVVKPAGGWVEATQGAITYMRSIKNTVYSHTDKCWISDKDYAELEREITHSIEIVLDDRVIKFEPVFKLKIEQWLGKSKELMTSRDNVLQYLQNDMKSDLSKIKDDQDIILSRTEEQTDMLRSLIESTGTRSPAEDLEVNWERLKDVTRRRYRNPLFNSPELIGPLQYTTLTLMDVWQELEVIGKGWFEGHISLVFERFLSSSHRTWCIEGDTATGKSCFLNKVCLQSEVYQPEKLVILVTPDKVSGHLTPDKDHMTLELDYMTAGHVVHNVTELLPLFVESCADKEQIVRCIEQHSDDLLFLLDGLDTTKMNTLQPLLSGQLLPNSKIIITSRHCRSIQSQNKSTILGINTRGRNTLVRRYLIALSDEEDILLKGIKLLKYFCNTLQSEYKRLFKKPIMLQFMCITYQHHIRTCYHGDGKEYDMRVVEEFLSELMRMLVLRGSQEMDVLRREISSYIDNVIPLP